MIDSLVDSLIVDVLVFEKVPGDTIALVERADIPSLLQAEDCIDLVIPRGSNALVQYIKNNTNIPVMGHADGICHVYVDEFADEQKALLVVTDSKTDYPSGMSVTYLSYFFSLKVVGVQ